MMEIGRAEPEGFEAGMFGMSDLRIGALTGLVAGQDRPEC
jgi:hypothetical protein